MRVFLRYRLWRIRRRIVLGALRGDKRRWMIFFAVSFAWRQIRWALFPPPEFVYGARLRPGERLAMATSKPLPRRLRTKRVRKALEAAARADVATAAS